VSGFDLRRYTDEIGRDVVDEWLESLADVPTRARATLRLERLERGLFGNCRTVGGGVQELKMDFDPGYRVYFGREGKRIVIFLSAEDKSTQQKDIRGYTACNRTLAKLPSPRRLAVVLRALQEVSAIVKQRFNGCKVTRATPQHCSKQRSKLLMRATLWQRYG